MLAQQATGAGNGPLNQETSSARWATGLLRCLDRHAERVLILIAYASMALIIIYAVVERFLFRTQIAWSSSVPIYLFLWVTWIGCAYNVRRRTHLSFNELRRRMPYTAQFASLWLDAVLWIAFASVVLYYTIEQVQIAKMNFAVVPGTSDLMQWWFYLATPVGWTLVVARTLQNLVEDIGRWRRREPFLIEMQAIGD